MCQEALSGEREHALEEMGAGLPKSPIIRRLQTTLSGYLSKDSGRERERKGAVARHVSIMEMNESEPP